MERFVISPIERSSAEAILQWQYPPPYDIYNIPAQDAQEVLAVFLDPAFAYHQICDETGELIGFCTFGEDARVRGGDYSQEALDIGMGVRPNLTGKGLGADFVQAVLGFARKTYTPSALRVTIAQFNKRAQRVWKKAGFVETQRFVPPNRRLSFLILTAKAGE